MQSMIHYVKLITTYKEHSKQLKNASNYEQFGFVEVSLLFYIFANWSHFLYNYFG